MSKTKKHSILFVTGLFLISSVFLGFWGSKSNGQSKKRDYQKANQPLGKPPIVDFQLSRTDSDNSPDTVSNRFNNKGRSEIKETAGVYEITRAESFVESLSTAPVDKSDLIIRCGVVEAKARISNDNTTVYSEFSITPTQIISGDMERFGGAMNPLSIFRMGGSVRFPSGHIQTYSLSGAGSLETSGDYIVFLRWDVSMKLYFVLTASKIENAKITPIDLTIDRKTFENEPLSDFLDTINLGIQQNFQKEKK